MGVLQGGEDGDGDVNDQGGTRMEMEVKMKMDGSRRSEDPGEGLYNKNQPTQPCRRLLILSIIK